MFARECAHPSNGNPWKRLIDCGVGASPFQAVCVLYLPFVRRVLQLVVNTLLGESL